LIARWHRASTRGAFAVPPARERSELSVSLGTIRGQRDGLGFGATTNSVGSA